MDNLVYRIERKKGARGFGFVVSIHERLSPHRKLYRDILEKLASQEEKRALEFLMGEHLRKERSLGRIHSLEMGTFNCVELEGELFQVFLDKLPDGFSLFWDRQRVELSCSSPLSVDWIGEEGVEGACQLNGYLLLPTKRIPFCESTLLFSGKRLVVLAEGKIWSCKVGVPLKWVEGLFQGTITLEREEIDLEEGISVRWKAPHPLVSLSPLPCLFLKDVYGSFADLWMDYGDQKAIAFHDPSPLVKDLRRNRAEERAWEADLVRGGFSRKEGSNFHYYCPVDRVIDGLRFLLQEGWIVRDFQGRKVVLQTDLTLHFSLEASQRIHIQGTFSFDGRETTGSLPVSPSKTALFLDLGNHSVGLLDSRFFPKGLSAFLEEEIPLKSHFGLLLPLKEEKGVTFDPSLQTLLEGFSSPMAPVSLPASFSGTLLDYQKKGVEWLHHLYRNQWGGLLADEMGLGKTVQILAFFSLLRTTLPILIVVPKTLIFNWKIELARFLPGLPVYIHNGPEREGDREELSKKSLILTSYAILRIDEELFSSLSYECVVLDEATFIKNAGTDIAQAAFLLQARFRIAASGTPMENGYRDLWSLFRFLMPGLLQEKEKKWLERGEHTPIEISWMQQKIAPFLLRRTKEEVELSLPPKSEQIVWVEMEEGQRRVYERVRASIQKTLLPKIEKGGILAYRMEILEAILRLRQICCHPLLLPDFTEGDEGCGKWDVVFFDLKQALQSGRKVLLYSQFTKMLQWIARQLTQEGIPHLYLDGKMKDKDREDQVLSFQGSSSPVIFLLSLKAGGVGLNLTEAEGVFLYDPWWNSAIEAQAIDRAHRIGQKKSVIARKYITVESIEERILLIQEKKRAQSLQMIEEKSSLSSVPWEELVEYFYHN